MGTHLRVLLVKKGDFLFKANICQTVNITQILISIKNQNNNYIKHFSVHFLQKIELMTEESHGRADLSLPVGLNRSNAEATFVQSTRMRIFVKTI